MFNFFKRLKVNYYSRTIPIKEREKIIALFFQHLSVLYAGSTPELIVRVDGPFYLEKNKFYYDIAKELLRRLKLNIILSKGTMEETCYFSFKIKQND